MGNIFSDIPKGYFDRFVPRPRDGFSSGNLRNNFMALASGDFLPCRAVCSVVLETHDVGADLSAAALYSGTGVTVTKDGANQYQGLACIKATVDGTNNRQILRTTYIIPINMSGFVSLGVWQRCNASSSQIQYVIRDSDGNESYWNITTNASPNTWEQSFLTLASPDANNGTPADLATVVSYGYKGLDAGLEYLFDDVTLFLSQMKVWIEPSYIGNYFYPFGFKFDGALTSAIAAPVANARIDLISIKNDGTTLTVTAGTPKAGPTFSDIPSTPATHLPLYAIYVPSTATKVVEFHQKDMFPNDAYIFADLRKLY